MQSKRNSLAVFVEWRMVTGILESNLTTSITIKKKSFDSAISFSVNLPYRNKHLIMSKDVYSHIICNRENLGRLGVRMDEAEQILGHHFTGQPLGALHLPFL